MILKKLWKVAWVTLVVLFSVIAIILVATLRPVDKTPYFQTEYYTETVDALNEALKNQHQVFGEIEAGFGVANITPTVNAEKDDPANGIFKAVPMAGFGDRKGPATGAHDSIFVKAAAIKVGDKMVLTISADLLLIPPYVADSVAIFLEKEAGISRDQLFLGATHTHSSIGASTPKWVGEKFSGAFNPNIISFLSRQFTQAALLAVADLKKSSIANVEIKAPELVRNRMSKENGRLNDNLTCISIQQENGRKAIIGTFSAHSTTLGERNLQFSGDWPGYWQRKIEEDYADVAIYFAGTLGSHTHRGEGESFEKSRFMGENLANRFLNSNSTFESTDSTSFSYFSIPLKTSQMQFRVHKNFYLAPYISNELIPEHDKSFIQGMKLGSLIWITAPFELSGEIALDVKNALKLKGYNSMFTSFNGDYRGYVTPSKYYYNNTYESFLMGWYGPSMGDYVSDLLYKSANGLTGERL
jgi:neutral ceramidase